MVITFNEYIAKNGDAVEESFGLLITLGRDDKLKTSVWRERPVRQWDTSVVGFPMRD